MPSYVHTLFSFLKSLFRLLKSLFSPAKRDFTRPGNRYYSAPIPVLRGKAAARFVKETDRNAKITITTYILQKQNIRQGHS